MVIPLVYFLAFETSQVRFPKTNSVLVFLWADLQKCTSCSVCEVEVE